MEKDGRREASLLCQQIKIIEHCAALVHGKVSKLPRPELQTHLHELAQSDLALPFDIRCQLISRRASDLTDDILDAKRKEEVMKLSKTLAGLLAVWRPADTNCDDTKIESRNVWGALMCSSQAAVDKSLKTTREAENELVDFAKEINRLTKSKYEQC